MKSRADFFPTVCDNSFYISCEPTFFLKGHLSLCFCFVICFFFLFLSAPSPLNVSQIMSSKDARTQSDSFISDVVSRFWDTSCRFMTPAWHLALKLGKNDFMDTVEYKTVRQPDIHQGLYVRKGDDWK